jgi:hypothetical protein
VTTSTGRSITPTIYGLRAVPNHTSAGPHSADAARAADAIRREARSLVRFRVVGAVRVRSDGRAALGQGSAALAVSLSQNLAALV